MMDVAVAVIVFIMMVVLCFIVIQTIDSIFDTNRKVTELYELLTKKEK